MKRNSARGFWGVLLLAILVAGGAVVMETMTSTRPARDKTAGKPYDAVSTFKSDPRTSRAFTWYTDASGNGTSLELVEGEAGVAGGTGNTGNAGSVLSAGVGSVKAGGSGGAFEGDGVLRFQGETTVLDAGGGGAERILVHKAEATGLKPGTTYTYRMGSGQQGQWSGFGTFTTEPAEGQESSFSFINVTDSQGEKLSDFKLWGQTLDKAFSLFPAARFIVHNGDLTEDPDNGQGWTDFFGQALPWVSAVPLMPVTGNHDEVNKKAEAYVSHFNLPDDHAEDSQPGTTYSFDYGNVHFVMLDTESNLKKQTEWLKADLASTDREWIIAAMHRPAYGGNTNDKTADWVKLFDEFHVDLVLQGHNHEYSRSYPLKAGKIAKPGEGTVYVVTNASGSKFNEKKSDKFYHAVHFQNYKQMFAAVTVSGKKLEFTAYDIDGRQLDQFVLQH